MPTTEDNTLKRIQREISEVAQREKELRSEYARLVSNGNGVNSDVGEVGVQLQPTPVGTVPKQIEQNKNGIRRFAPNPSIKGMMQRFIKSRGKVNALLSTSKAPSESWVGPLSIDPPKVSLSPGKPLRNGYVPVEERMKREFQDMYNRESELRSERKKSQPDLMAYFNGESPEPEKSLRAAKSMAQLYDPEEFSGETCSAPSSLRPARSLAQLCDADDEEIETPGSLTLIRQWESMIRKNRQPRT